MLNTQRNTLEEKLATSGLPAGDIAEAGKLLANVNGEIEQLEERWLELSESRLWLPKFAKHLQP